MSKQTNKHQIESPMDRCSYGITTCNCGAEWLTYYAATGMVWKPLNEKCAEHDEEVTQQKNKLNEF